MIDSLRNGYKPERLTPSSVAAIGEGKTVHPDETYDLQTLMLYWRNERCKMLGEKLPLPLAKKLKYRLNQIR